MSAQMRDDEFERLYEAEAQGLFGFLAYRTGDRALAEDLLADTFERALRSRQRFDRRRGLGQDVAVRDRAQPAARPRAARGRRGRGRSSASGRRRPARRTLGDAVEHRDVVQRALAALSARRSARRSRCASAPS